MRIFTNWITTRLTVNRALILAMAQKSMKIIETQMADMSSLKPAFQSGDWIKPCN